LQPIWSDARPEGAERLSAPSQALSKIEVPISPLLFFVFFLPSFLLFFAGTLKERSEMRDRLRLAILTNDRSTVLEIIQDKESCPTKELNHLDQNGRSCILNAAFAYQLDICLDFLDAGADVNVFEKESGNSVLHYLSKPQEPKEDDILLTLKTILHGVLAKGCNPNQTDSEGCTPLHYASRVANVAVAAVLIQHGAVINTKNENGETALHWAVLNQQVIDYYDCDYYNNYCINYNNYYYYYYYYDYYY
jgi:ankyrin repeat protein